MEIFVKEWNCSICQTSEGKPLQVDYIDEQYILISNYYDQYLLPTQKVSLNDCICYSCADKLLVKQHKFEPEPNYTFEQNGLTCWNIDRLNAYQREIICSGCRTSQNLSSLLSNCKNEILYVIWTENLCSLAFHDFDLPKVYTLTTESKYKDTICEDCFKQENWKPCSKPIECQFCHRTYCRAINRYDDKPRKYALECAVHTNKNDGYIYDSIIDPEEYVWVKKPENYDQTKVFCLSCLEQFVKDNIIKLISHEIISDEENEMINTLREKHPDLFKLSFEQ